jgi:putative tricarboxylic transport membrane protein
MRQADIVFALCLLGLAVLVAWESLTLHIGWGLNGPESGFFPFWLAIGLGICSLIILGQAVWQAAPSWRQPFVQAGGWTPLLTVALPALAMVLLTECIGLYPATALYLAFYMRRVGQHRWPLVLAISLGVPLGSYFLFDKWFLIPMPKGLWGERLGL